MTTYNQIAPDEEIIRDRWGRPLIRPVDGTERIPYTRASTLARALSDSTALTNWKMRQVAVGAALRPDLLALVAAAHSTNDTKTIDTTCTDLLEAAGGNAAANLGTALHSVLETVDRGGTPYIPAGYTDDVEAYMRATERLEVLGIERFVVQDELQTAGTFDRLVQLPDGRIVVADLKTGSSAARYPLSVAIQTAVYAHGTVYTEKDGRKGHLPEMGVSTDVALLIHLPAGKGTCTLHLLDIATGWEAAKTAVSIRALNKRRDLATTLEMEGTTK